MLDKDGRQILGEDEEGERFREYFDDTVLLLTHEM